MNTKLNKLLEDNGWAIECEEPIKIKHSDGSIATGKAVNIVLWALSFTIGV